MVYQPGVRRLLANRPRLLLLLQLQLQLQLLLL